MKEIDFDEPIKKKEGIHSTMATPAAHTFRADVEDLIKQKKISRTGPALSKTIRRESQVESRFPLDNDEPQLGKVIFILLLVLAFGIGVGGYTLFGTRMGSLFGSSATTTPSKPTFDDIFVDIGSSPREQVLADISIAFQKTYLPSGGRRMIIFSAKNNNEDVHNATYKEFVMSVMEHQPPASLDTAIENTLSYQIYSGSTLSGIIILSSRSYPNTFASMLEWEPDMAAALIPILDPFYSRKSVQELRERKFKDEQYQGVSIRTLSNLDGEIVLAYGFIDKKTLIITGALDSMHALITKGVEIK